MSEQAPPPFHIAVTQEGFDALANALKAEADGKELRKELAKNLREELKPAAALAKSGIMSMGSSGLPTSPGLRSSIAKKIRPEVKLGGRWSGARVKAKKTPNVRNFAQAPRRTQRPAGWRTQSYGNGEWRTQHGKVKWFDRAMDGHLTEYRAAIARAMDAMAERIANRSE